MTGFVLALAGLTCGDGGMGAGAAREPVGINFEACAWEGHWNLCGADLQAELHGGVFRVTAGGQHVISFWVVRTGQSGRRLYYQDRGRIVGCTMRLDGDRLTVKAGMAVLTLKPAASKP
jgi:hypothetical protein